MSLTRDDLQQIRSVVGEVVRTELNGVRGELGELRDEFGGLRGEFEGLRGEFGELRGELWQVRDDLRGELAMVRDEIRQVDERLGAKIDSVKVMLEDDTRAEARRLTRVDNRSRKTQQLLKQHLAIAS